MNKLIIFDLDGTVIDTINDLCDAMNFMLVDFGYKQISVEQMKKNIGGSTREIVRLSISQEITDQQLDRCVDVFTDYYIGGGSPKTKPFENIKEVIVDLKKRGYKIVALSNKPQYEINPLYDRVLKPLGFDKVVGLSESVLPKPNPSATLSLIKEFDATNKTTYFIGDGETDVMTAINAKVNCIAVLWGNRDKEFLSKYGAKVFAKEPFELLELIK